jgi:neutral ceramidase
MSVLMVGCGAANITPALGVFMAGYFHERNATAVHDELYARALVFDDGDTKAAILVCDIICIPTEIVAQVRAAVERETDIPGGHVMVSATHTHTGPRTRSSRIQEEEGPTREWLASFPDRAAQAVVEATGNLEPCQVAGGVAHEDRIAFNRRYRMEDGTVQSNPGQQNPGIIEPAGPIDPEVGVLSFTRADGTLKAILVHYSCHLDNVGGTELSADYPGYLAARLQERLPDRPSAVYVQGACGDINHINVRSPYRRHGHEHSRWMGETLAGDVCEALKDMEPLSGAQVAVTSKVIDLPIREGAEAQIRQAEIQAIRVGDVGFAGIPAEYFVELQLDIKARSPFRRTFVAELGNGWVGYVPTRKAFDENMKDVPLERMTNFDHKGYEVRSALSMGFEPGIGELMANTAVQLLEDLHAAQ